MPPSLETTSPAPAERGHAQAPPPLLVCRLQLDGLEDLEPTLSAAVRSEAQQRLAQQAGAEHVAARGDGFLLSLVSPLEEAGALLGRLLDAVALQPFDLGQGQHLRRSASIGWAPYPWQPGQADGPDRARVLQLAERALYMAQRSGRNQAVGILPMDDDRCGASVRLVRVLGPDLIVDEPTTPLPAL